MDNNLISRSDRTSLVLNSDGIIDEIVAIIANGGDLLDWCNVNRIRYSDCIKWINNNDDRKDIYRLALDAREEWFYARILKEVHSIALSDIRHAVDEFGNLKDIKDLPDNLAKSISSIDVTQDFDSDGRPTCRTSKIRLWDKMKALDMLNAIVSARIQAKGAREAERNSSTVRYEELSVRIRQITEKVNDDAQHTNARAE